MLDGIELNERIRSLRPGQRLGYSFGLALIVTLAYVLALLLAVFMAAVMVLLLVGGPLRLPDDVLSLSLPVWLAFMFAIGITGQKFNREYIPVQTLSQTALDGLRSGLVGGAVVGFVFGLGWSLLIHADALMFGFTLSVSIAGGLGIFRVVARTVEPFCLRLFSSAR